MRRCNDFLTEQLADAPTACTRWPWSTSPILRPRSPSCERASAGRAAFFLYTVNGRPPGDRLPGSSEWDPVWSAATDLGMIAVIHVGNTATDFNGWADIGWDEPGGAGVEGLVRLANTQRVHAAQNLLVGMLYGGVFARHPT